MKGYRFRSKDGSEYIVRDEPVERLFTVQDLYNMRQNSDQILSCFGYDGQELIKIIEEYERRNVKVKMTREEAAKKLQKWPNQSFNLIEILEALGLLKFEEEPESYTIKSGEEVLLTLKDTVTNNQFKVQAEVVSVDKCK